MDHATSTVQHTLATSSSDAEHDRNGITSDELAAIDRLIQESGYIKAAKRLQVSLGVLMRAVGHLGLRRGSVLAVRAGLKEDAEERAREARADRIVP